ncbi:hypothetical protein D3C81_1527950 [compost metagenome]
MTETVEQRFGPVGAVGVEVIGRHGEVWGSGTSKVLHKYCGEGGLAPLGREAAPISVHAVSLWNPSCPTTTATQSNGGKPPRHKC